MLFFEGNLVQIPAEFIKAAEKEAAANGCSIVSIDMKKEKKASVLRIVINGADTSLDVCAKISRSLSKWLDANEDKIPVENYVFEVSSPGIDNVKMETDEDYAKYIGKIINIVTKTKASDGRKRYRGRLKSVENGVIHLYVEEESADFNLSVSDISKSRIEYEF